MNNITTFSKFSMFSVFLLTSSLLFAQQDGKQEELKIIIKKMEIIDGDTITEEKILTGDEAKAYREENDDMIRYRVRSRNNVTDTDRDSRDRSVNRANDRRVVIKTYDEKAGDGEIVRSEVIEEIIKEEMDELEKDLTDLHKKIVIDLEMELENEINKIEVMDDKVIIINGDGKEQIIEIDGKGSNGNKMHRVIVINDDKVETEDGKVKSASGSKGKISAGNSTLDFYPNPNEGEFTLEIDLKDNGKASITIVDVNGKTIYEETVKGSGIQKKQIDLRSFGKGIYFVNLKQKGEALSKKVIIE